MTERFFEAPILNSPYAPPNRHWELDGSGQPTNRILPNRRRSSLVSPIPKAKKVKGKAGQADLYAPGSSGAEQEYNPTEVINGIRSAVESWRVLPESQWNVKPGTARLLRHWRTHEFANQRPFFCQLEAVETVIWLTEVAPRTSAQGRRFWAHLAAANAASNPALMRLALKLATGAGKTTVMAMLIAWQTVNAVRHPDSQRFSKGFLIVAPGITIKDRLRVLQPNDPDSYYRSREIVPEDMIGELGQAKIVITNYHAFKRKFDPPLNKVQEAALKTKAKLESDGKFVQRVANELMGLKNVVVLNDEAHHCYLPQGLGLSRRLAVREVMNTVGRKGQLGEHIRCVVSVSMLTEGWDANTVTHVLGVRAFGTQLLCEQVIGRALRRQSYAAQPDGRFKVEYADVFGIPFDFTAQAVKAPPAKPDNLVTVRAVSPDRDHLEIRFPRVDGYRVELPQERVTARFDANSDFELNPLEVSATETTNSGIIGETADFTLKHLDHERRSTIIFKIANYIIERYFADEDGRPKLHLFPQIKAIVRHWMDRHLRCTGGTKEAQLLYQVITDKVASRIHDAITRANSGGGAVKAILDPYNREGSTRHVLFTTSKDRWETAAERCHVNYAVLDSDWEAEFCRVAEKHPRVLAYVKNHNLGFEAPYRCGGEVRRYRPDFIVRLDDGGGPDDPLNLVVETKGYRGEDAKDKAATMETYWVPGVNNLGTHGRWAFAEFTKVFEIASGFEALIDSTVQRGRT